MPDTKTEHLPPFHLVAHAVPDLLYDINRAWSDTDSNGMEVSHLETTNSIATHTQNAMLTLHRERSFSAIHMYSPIHTN